MKTKLAVPILLVGLFCSGCAPDPVQDPRRELDKASNIQGYPCAKGYAWFYADDHLNRCTITREIAFGEARIPKGSIIQLRDDGTPELALMSHAAPVLGMRCAGGGLLGPAEGASIGFYPSGKVRLCYLAGNQTVRGIPCASSGFWAAAFRHEVPVEFNESGSLKSCGLAADFGGRSRGERFVATE